MKTTDRRLFGLVALLVLAAFALAGCGAVIGAGVRGATRGLESLGKKNLDKMTAEERAEYVQQQNILSYAGSLDQISKVIDEVIEIQRDTLRVKTWRALIANKKLYLDPVSSVNSETFAMIELAVYDSTPNEVVIFIRSGDAGNLSPSGILARKLKVLIDSALRARKIALLG